MTRSSLLDRSSCPRARRRTGATGYRTPVRWTLSSLSSSLSSSPAWRWIIRRRAGRPGRRPGGRSPEQGLLIVIALASGVGLSFLRSNVNLSILEASRTLADRRRAAALVERDADAMRVQVERLAAIDRIEPEGRRAGLDRPPAEAVMLLAAHAPHDFPAARPLGVPGAGVLGRWLEQAAQAARVPPAVAAPEESQRGEGRERGRARSPSAAADARSLLDSACQVAGEHGERGTRCEACRALAAGQTIPH